MKSLSSTYVQLQKVYRAKAIEDMKTFQSYLAEVLEQVNLPSESITLEEIESFTKHAAFLKVIRGRTLKEMMESPREEALGEQRSRN
jgi:amyloid beta precursor protein binding protein 1